MVGTKAPILESLRNEILHKVAIQLPVTVALSLPRYSTCSTSSTSLDWICYRIPRVTAGLPPSLYNLDERECLVKTRAEISIGSSLGKHYAEQRFSRALRASAAGDDNAWITRNGFEEC